MTFESGNYSISPFQQHPTLQQSRRYYCRISPDKRYKYKSIVKTEIVDALFLTSEVTCSIKVFFLMSISYSNISGDRSHITYPLQLIGLIAVQPQIQLN